MISGLNGLGAEVAKNVILANVKAVTLHDDKAATAADAGSHFYLGEAEVGKNRATVCAQQMQELNRAWRCAPRRAPSPLEHLSNFTIVVAIDVPLDIALKADAFCRAQSPPIAFIRADVRGLCGMVFADFGPTFTCLDPTGESIKSAIVETIYPLNDPPKDGMQKIKVHCVEDDDLDLDDGDHITFSEVEGMGALNGIEPQACLDVSKEEDDRHGRPGRRRCRRLHAWRPHHRDAHAKVLEYSEPRDLCHGAGQPLGGGRVEDGAGGPFSEEFLGVFGSPKANTCYGRSGLLHLGFRALDAYVAKHGALPPPVDAAAAEEMVAIAKSINDASPDKVAQLDLPGRALNPQADGDGRACRPLPDGRHLRRHRRPGGCQGGDRQVPSDLPGLLLRRSRMPAGQGAAAGGVFAASASGRHEGRVSVFGSSFQQRLRASTSSSSARAPSDASSSRISR